MAESPDSREARTGHAVGVDLLDPRDDRRTMCAAVIRSELSSSTLRAIACVMILATLVPVANASGRRLVAARIAVACPNLSVYAGKVVGTLNLRFQLKGAVSCSDAHRLIIEFFKQADAGKCEGTACIVQLPKGWSCSYFFATESKETGGALTGCAQAATGAKVRVYKAGAATTPVPKHHLEAAEFFVRYPHDRDVTCAIYDGRSGVQTLCETERPSYEQKATLELSGIVSACSAHNKPLTNRCDLGNTGEGTPTFRPGKQITVGRFRCRILTNGVQCILTTNGRGFLFTPTAVLPVGGATVRKPPTPSSPKKRKSRDLQASRREVGSRSTVGFRGIPAGLGREGHPWPKRDSGLIGGWREADLSP